MWVHGLQEWSLSQCLLCPWISYFCIVAGELRCHWSLAVPKSSFFSFCGSSACCQYVFAVTGYVFVLHILTALSLVAKTLALSWLRFTPTRKSWTLSCNATIGSSPQMGFSLCPLSWWTLRSGASMYGRFLTPHEHTRNIEWIGFLLMAVLPRVSFSVPRGSLDMFCVSNGQVLPRDPLLPPPLPLEGESVQEMMAEVLRMISAAGCGTPEVFVLPISRPLAAACDPTLIP